MTSQKSTATKSFINAANEFEKIERILLYFNVSNFFINQDKLTSIKKLHELNQKLELPYELNNETEKDFLEIKYYENTLSTMLYIRMIDSFINYFKEVLAEIVMKNPKILKSSEKESLDFILSYTSYSDLINALAEKKVEALFYGGINDIQKYFKERLGVELFETNYQEVNLLVKQRNLAVHNGSKISKDFVRQFPDENFQENMLLAFKFDYIEKLVLALYKITNDIEAILSSKFNLELISY